MASSDNFTRANSSSSLGANWTILNGTLGIASNHAAATNTNGNNFALWNADVFTANQTAQAIVFYGGGAGFLGPGCRLSSGGNGYIAMGSGGGTNTVELHRFDSSASTLLATYTATLTDGDVIELSVSGTTLTTTLNGTDLGTFTDSTYATGQPGIYIFNSAAASISLWSADTLSSNPTLSVDSGAYALTGTAATLSKSGNVYVLNNLPWISQDIGSPAIAGSDSYDSGTFTVFAAGADIFGTSDEFRFIHQTLTGDGELICYVPFVTPVNTFSKAGVMVRADLTAGSANAAMFLTAGDGIVWQNRPTSGASSTFTQGAVSGPPHFIRVVRTGTTVDGYYSYDGSNWTFLDTVTLPIGTTVYLGFAVTSHDVTTATEAQFSSITVIGNVATYALVGGDVTFSVGTKGHTVLSASSGTLAITGTAATLSKTTHHFTVSADSGVYTLSFTNPATTGAPLWVKVNRTGATITGSYSTDGGSWIPIGTATPAFGSRTYIGLAVTSHDPGVTATGTFTNVTVTGFGATYGELGTDASFSRTHRAAVASGAYVLTGADINLVYSHSNHFTVVAGSGSYAETGASVGLAVGRKVAATSGAFTVTGATVVVRTGHSIRPGSGVYLVTGTDVTDHNASFLRKVTLLTFVDDTIMTTYTTTNSLLTFPGESAMVTAE